MIRRIAAAAALIAATFVLAGCGPDFQRKADTATGVYRTVTESTVPPETVIPAANAFDILKAGAVNYGRYCIKMKMQPAICDASIRRVVIKSVRAGTNARNQLEASVEQKQPALSSIYNVLVAAVSNLQNSPAAGAEFVEGVR